MVFLTKIKNLILFVNFVQKISANADVEKRVYTTVASSIKQPVNRPDTVVHEKIAEIIYLINCVYQVKIN